MMQHDAARSYEIALDLPLEEWAGRWFMSMTRLKHTASVGSSLMSFGVPTLVLFAKRPRVWRGKTVWLWEPCFPGYVFSCIESDEQWYVFKRQPHRCGEVRAIRNAGRFVKEMQQVRQMLQINPRLGSCDPVVEGKCVRIIRGHWQGFEGYVDRRFRSRGRVVVSLKVTEPQAFFGPLEAEADDVEVICAVDAA